MNVIAFDRTVKVAAPTWAEFRVIVKAWADDQVPQVGDIRTAAAPQKATLDLLGSLQQGLRVQ